MTPSSPTFQLLPFEAGSARWSRDGFEVDTDRQRIDVPATQRLLIEESYWAQESTADALRRAIAGSVAFGLYDGSRQIGFARVVTDGVAFAYVRDVIVASAYRGRGLGLWLMQTIGEHPDLIPVRRWMLSTRDAHTLYEKVGFKRVGYTDLLMTKAAE
ncbi:GNAT family N-acetyltransferase [Paraburkholderia sp. BL17N1]|uniref:GNAT family N-acetyltransferase n=1 Tax=Paraburkholderia sp. BL17N1 TaxID=1938798 RepID=UPI000EB05B9E|nr:GNAT family N-acetyltransferase [Paraburkholderia sp. BL17N1]RKR38863.1 ribosomal protein S18 acetylase RimI-like enzyme [Paraburkholderia sp. BL17N1]